MVVVPACEPAGRDHAEQIFARHVQVEGRGEGRGEGIGDGAPRGTDGGRDIAGNPVNIASKLAEDSGLGGVLVESSVLTEPLAAQLAASAEPFRLTISRVELTGYRVPV